MAYLGNAPVVGDSTNSFRLLDDIASFTVTFDATDTSVVSISGDTLSFTNHRFVTGQKVTYTDGGGTAIGGLTDGTSYFIIKVDQNTIKLATNASNAASSTAINLTSGAAGGSHTLKVAFDGVNTKFKATFNNGRKASISRAAQLSLSINGVIQQPQDSSSPSVGYGVEADSTIVFSTAPAATDKVFGSFIGEVAPSFDIEDNTIDNFTGDGSTTIFNLSKEVPSSQDVLVTLDGVTQHPSDASTTRSYSVIDQALTFVSAPDTGVAIQARHIGFAGATTSAVTGFYGRTGNAALINTDDISVQNISAGIATFNTISVGGTVSIGGTLTYEDVTNIDSVGLVTARNGIVVGSGITLSKDGDVFFTGIATGNGSGLTALNASNISSGTVPTARLGSGTASSSTFLRGDSTFQTVSTDLVDDTTPQLGGNLDVNTKNIVFGDSGGATDDRLTFGAGTDLSIYHDGSHSYISEQGTGNLRILTSSVFTVNNAANSQNMILATDGGSVDLYHNGTKTFETQAAGITVQGGEGGSGQINLFSDEGDDDADKWRITKEAGNNSFRIQNYTSGSWETNILATGNGAVELYNDNSKRVETTTNGIELGLSQGSHPSGAFGGGYYSDIVINNCGTASGADGGSGVVLLSGNASWGGFIFADNDEDQKAYIKYNHSADTMYFGSDGADRVLLDGTALYPNTNNAIDLGSTSKRFKNIYTTDLQLSNEGKTNDVDGTWGDYTIQEGESDLFLINNRSGKKYKFNLTEVS